ncbi:MAG: hypothetical protein WC428_08540 [Candidatus Paceibacterota bacterium]
MTINCLPINRDIKTGFDCTLSGDLANNSATLISLDGTPNTYVENYWTNGELIIAILLFIFLTFEVLKYSFEFFFPKIIEVKKWHK